MTKDKKNFFPITPNLWKRSTLVILCTILLSFTGCVKQKKCDCGTSGTFEYLDKPFTVKDPNSENKDEKVVAIFKSTVEGNKYNIIGSVPTKYKTKEPIKVRACTKLKNTSRYKDYLPQPIVYKLTCIEKED
jgi:hypothetical protein